MNIELVSAAYWLHHPREKWSFRNIKKRWVCFKSQTLSICLFSPSSSSFSRYFQDIGELGVKKSDHRTANTIQLFVAITIDFFNLFFSEENAAKGNSLDYVINIATCLFAQHFKTGWILLMCKENTLTRSTNCLR